MYIRRMKISLLPAEDTLPLAVLIVAVDLYPNPIAPEHQRQRRERNLHRFIDGNLEYPAGQPIILTEYDPGKKGGEAE